MATASVNVTFEAATMDEAKAVIAAWSLPEGSRIHYTIAEGMSNSSGVVDSSGNLIVTVPGVPDEPTS